MKKLISLLLTISMLVGIFGTFAVSAADLPFTDVKTDDWFYEYIKEAYEEGIMQGKSSDIFDPEAQTTRAEFVKVLCCMSGDDYLGKDANLAFTDIKAGAWYVDFVGWGVKHDIVKGLPGNKFGPDQPVTRQEMAVFIDRFVKYLDKELPNNPKVDSFKDAAEVDSWATESVELMRVSGIITGNDSGYFKPKSNASRAEIATVITRLLPIIKGSKVEVEEPDEAPLPYTIYLPEDYNEAKDYPLLVYLTNGSTSGVNIFFESSDSPAHDSIVLIPHLSSGVTDSKISILAELFDYIHSKYNTDSTRQYFTAVGSEGGFISWQFMLKYPEKVSAALFVQATTVRFVSIDGGPQVIYPNDYNDRMLDIPIYIVHDTTKMGMFYPEYGEWAYEALSNVGSNVFLKETTGYGDDIVNHFVSETDISLLEWLFEQRRETK